MLSTEEAATKQLVLSSHLLFTRYFFKHRHASKLIVNIHHELICKTLDRVISGEIKRLIINIAPRYTKTEMAVIAFIARGFAINPRSKFIHSSYSEDLALENSAVIKEVLLSEEYQKFWPYKVKKDSNAKNLWKLAGYNGALRAAPSGGTITGFGAGLMETGFNGAYIIDDPLKPMDAYSDVIRKQTNEHINRTIKSRLASRETPIILVMQRLHEDDVTGFLLNGGSGEKWHHLCIPCEITDEVKKYDYDAYPYGIPIPLDIPNGALWPYKHSLEELYLLRKTDPYTSASQYDQRPSPIGGGLFKDSWWKYYKREHIPHFEYRIITADTAQKDKEYNDYSVFICFGVRGDELYILDILRGKWESPELKVVFKDFFDKHNFEAVGWGKLRMMYVEDKASGTDLIQNLQKTVPIQAIQRKENKVTRAMDTVPYLAGGKVLLPEEADWCYDFKDEIRKFTPTMTHKHDDQVDAFMDGVKMTLMSNVRQAGGW
jgi:predicted phage terminase large subunit-like protein